MLSERGLNNPQDSPRDISYPPLLLGPEKVFPRICLPKFLANVGWTFWCEILLKPFICEEKAQFVHEILGKASDDSLLLEDFFGPRS